MKLEHMNWAERRASCVSNGGEGVCGGVGVDVILFIPFPSE